MPTGRPSVRRVARGRSGTHPVADAGYRDAASSESAEALHRDRLIKGRSGSRFVLANGLQEPHYLLAPFWSIQSRNLICSSRSTRSRANRPNHRDRGSSVVTSLGKEIGLPGSCTDWRVSA